MCQKKVTLVYLLIQRKVRYGQVLIVGAFESERVGVLGETEKGSD